MLNHSVCFIGAGAMAEAIIEGLIKKKTLSPQQIAVVNKSNRHRLEALGAKYGVVADPSAKNELIHQADILILAMKPKDVRASLTEIKPFTHHRQIIISVVAGMATQLITELLGHSAPVIRTMPNTSEEQVYRQQPLHLVPMPKRSIFRLLTPFWSRLEKFFLLRKNF